mmetsp:Transcript_58968/g.125044  ORF Transcript_58968/g.125044 Transcript_58968/m.125044 type:complete len:171 (+) Transcript_58968:94-606(+)|eukprot:CAMPEP_0206465120 /NCGR_PEP_ID=MMETSP0324_2-20121206/27633_1 /ASSEMBLY_ACC=CAM_ASM_000836 /TAXON_ID=2866 /ORGANISM="Crypthecodinium cohnii, Strain Seligo" /LENGTH=170 /DNA_ID=CAMNT_0053937903 /DNA_START=65 /DNA_END=577 /DNA_ORIENTATION=+
MGGNICAAAKADPDAELADLGPKKRYAQAPPDAEAAKRKQDEEVGTWERVAPAACEPEYLVVSALRVFLPEGLSRYLRRRAQVTGFQCFEYEIVDSNFRINVPSHALSITKDVGKSERVSKILEANHLTEEDVVLVKTIETLALCSVQALNGDKAKLKMITVEILEKIET